MLQLTTLFLRLKLKSIMLEFINELYENLEDGLKFIDEDLSQQEKDQRAILIVRDTIDQLKDHMKDDQFQDEKEEISFFRDTLPLFYSQLILHIRLFNLETNRQGMGRKACRKLLQDELKGINLFFKKQIAFRQYYHSGSTILD